MFFIYVPIYYENISLEDLDERFDDIFKISCGFSGYL